MISKRYESLLFAFFMSTVMSLLMSAVITLINIGFVSGFIFIWLEAFAKALIIAFPLVLLLVPQIKKLVHIFIKDI